MNGAYHLNLYIEKNSRVYVFSIPVNSPYEEASEVAKEFAEGVLDLQKQVIENAEKAKLQQEMRNAHNEASEEK